MIRKVKNWLGIEGVKIKLEVPTNLREGQPEIKFVLCLSTLTEQKIKGVHLTLKEVYRRGRGEHNRITEFILAEWKQEKKVEMGKNDSHFIPITLKPNWQSSAVDQWQKKGGFQKILGAWAKKWQGVKSEYIVEVNIDVAKTKLNPFQITRLEIAE